MKIVNHKDLQELVRTAYDKKLSLFVWGKCGIGKSDSVRQVAMDIAKSKKLEYNEDLAKINDEKNFSIVDIRVSQLDPSDLRGLPKIDNGTTKWLSPDWLPVKGQGILFFDELNLSCPAIQASCYQLILDRRLGDYILPKQWSIISAGNRMCIKKGTILLGDNKPIELIKINDKVFGKSSINFVKETFSRSFEGNLIQIRGRYLLPFECTEEHPILVIPYEIKGVRKIKHGKKYWTDEMIFEEAEWISASMLLDKINNGKKFCLTIPRIKTDKKDGSNKGFSINLDNYKEKNQKIKRLTQKGRGVVFPVNKETSWLLGLYLAEGWTSNNHINFALSSHEMGFSKKIKDTIEKHLKYSVYTSKVHNNSITVSTSSGLLANAFRDWFNEGASHKQIPEFIMCCERPKFIKEFLKGYFDGDGYISKSKNRRIMAVTASTSSKVLALQIQLLLAKFGMMIGLMEKKGLTRKIRDKTWKFKKSYTLQANNDKLLHYLGLEKDVRKHKGNKFHHVFKDKILVPIKYIQKHKYSGKVYNIETSDNTYLINNCVTHNCDGAGVFEMAVPLQNRFLHVELEAPSVDDWIDWGVDRQIDHRIMSFLKFKPNLLFKWQKESKEKSFPTPRSWFFTSQLIKDMPENNGLMNTLVSTAIGEATAIEFTAFLKLSKKIDIEKLLENPSKFAVPTDAQMVYSLVSGIIEFYKRDKKLMENILKITNQLEPEFAVLALKLMKSVNRNFVTDVMKSPEWKKMSDKLGKYLL